MPTLRRLARRMRTYRKRRGLSQAGLAERAGVGRVYIARLERARQDPRLTVVVRIAAALGVRVGTLVE